MDHHENCHVEPIVKPLGEIDWTNAKGAYLDVAGMGCPSCATRVRNGLLQTPGVIMAHVFLDQALAVAVYDPKQVKPEELTEAVFNAGNDGKHHYRARIVTVIPAEKIMEK